MTQEKFIALSEDRVKDLNGSDKEASFEAWRDGYLTLVSYLRDSFINDFHDTFLNNVEDIISQDLNSFKGW